MKLTARFLGASLAIVAMSAVADETITYQYDELGRLRVVDRSGSVNDGAQSEYTFDAAGNRTGVVQDDGTGGSAALALPEAGTTEVSLESGRVPGGELP